ncbi:MAG: VCBS repeat-containing protein [Opitutales bacterium]|nr:VCBS repeat-containing protein [Opitutales bacterium]
MNGLHFTLKFFPILFGLGILAACGKQVETSVAVSNPPVASRLSEAQASDGQYISWKEHLIDGEEISGVPLSGSDGITMEDLDKDGFPDFVSVHESDVEYDGVADGYIRIAFGSADPDQWESVTLAAGPEAGAAEDTDIADFNGDGWPDIVAACELEHLIYFQNPGKNIRSQKWEHVIPSIMANRGSFIRVFSADFNNDGKLEIVAPNKGSQSQSEAAKSSNPISWFEIIGEPLDGDSWVEHELTRLIIPENSRTVDLDGDGDLDILGASRGEGRILWFENLGTDPISFKEHAINAFEGDTPYPITGVNVDFHDFNQDGRLDILGYHSPEKRKFGWIEQPDSFDKPWKLFPIGDTAPDMLIGVVLADINSDGNPDVMIGTYSGGPRDRDGEDKTVNDNMGRIVWFEHPGDLKGKWVRHDISRRIRGMFDQFVPIDLDKDGDVDFVSTRGNSYPYDGVFWLEQIRTDVPTRRFTPARKEDSREMGLPTIAIDEVE